MADKKTKKKKTTKNNAKKKNLTSKSKAKISNSKRTTNKSVSKVKAQKQNTNKPLVKEETIPIPNDKDKNLKSLIYKLKDKLKRKKKSNYKKIKKYKRGKLIKKIKIYERKIKMYGLLNVIGIKPLVTITIMLLIILFIISTFLSLNKENYIYELETLPESLDQLKTLSYDINDTDNIIEESSSYGKLNDYYTYDFEEVFNLNSKYVEEYIIKYNSKSKEAFIVIKPTDDHDQDIKKTFDDFFKSEKIKNYDYLSYQEYQFFIASKNNTLVLSKIKQSQIRVFDPLKELKKAEIEETLNIPSNLYDEALVKEAMLVSQNTGYYIFKSNSKRHIKKIEELMDEYFTNKEQTLGDDQVKLVKDRVKRINKNYIIYVVSYDNNLVMELLNE